MAKRLADDGTLTNVLRQVVIGGTDPAGADAALTSPMLAALDNCLTADQLRKLTVPAARWSSARSVGRLAGDAAAPPKLSHPGVRVSAMRQISAPAPSDGQGRARRDSPFAEARRADRELRRIVLRVREWGLANGRCASTDALTAIAAAVLDEARQGQRSPWLGRPIASRRSSVWPQPRACARLDAALPPELEPAMCLLLDYLDAMGVLAGSAPVDELKAALEARGPLRSPRSSRRASPRHPAGSARR